MCVIGCPFKFGPGSRWRAVELVSFTYVTIVLYCIKATILMIILHHFLINTFSLNSVLIVDIEFIKMRSIICSICFYVIVVH
jgi:hypothetical protein